MQRHNVCFIIYYKSYQVKRSVYTANRIVLSNRNEIQD